MKLSHFFATGAMMLLTALPGSIIADEGPLDTAAPKGVTPQDIITRFAAKEKEFSTARDQYTYRQSITVQTLDDGEKVDGEYKQVFDVTFDDKGRKIKNVIFAPQNSLERIQMTEEDVDDLENLRSFVFTTDELPEYNVLYVGQQQEDDLHCFVFDVAPKTMAPKKHYFQGRIWVDDQDLQVVKSYGKLVPEKHVNRKGKGQENLFPNFTTWREQIDGKYWFPTYSRADDVLHFHNPPQDIRVRNIIKFTDYQKFGTKVRVTYEGKEVSQDKSGDKSPTPPPAPK